MTTRPRWMKKRPKDRYWLTVGPHPKEEGKHIAIVTDCHPRKALPHGMDKMTILSIEKCDSVEAAHRWFNEVTKTQPWKTRQ